MKSFRKNILTLITGTILVAGVLVNNAFASATWLSSITAGQDFLPVRVAIDGSGNIYVTQSVMNRLQVFSRKGTLLRTMNGLRWPLGVAVDGSGNVYIGNSKSHSVDVYKADFAYSFSLGNGNGEFQLPSDIAVSASGMIYVADTNANAVRVYNPNGAQAFVFGGYGTNGSDNGTLFLPEGIAIDNAASEIYVTDHMTYPDTSGTTSPGSRVQVFDLLTGAFKRTSGQLYDPNSASAFMRAPAGIALDGSGKVYVADSGPMQAVQVFDAYGSFIETIADANHPLRLPVGIAIGKDGRMFICSSRGPSVDVFGLPGYTTMDASPASLSFSAPQGTANPATQPVTISNSGTGNLNWTAAADKPWISLAPAAGTAMAGSTSALNVGADMTGLTAGDNSGTVTITGASGATETVAVTLTVTAPPAIGAAPAALVFSAAQGAGSPAAQAAIVSISGVPSLDWTAVADKTWISVTPAKGASAPSSPVSIAVNTQGMTQGTYSGTVTVTDTAGTSTAIAVTLGIAPPPSISASPSSLTFNAAQSAGNPAVQPVIVTISGVPSLGWTASADKTWITVTPAGDTAAPSSTPNIAVNAQGMTQGTYSGTVTFTDTAGTSTAVAIGLTIAPPPASLAVTPAGLSFSAQQNGSAPASQTIDIRNMGGGSMTWTASKTQPWLSLSAASGTAPVQVLASVNTSAMTVGTYSDTVTINASGAQGSPAQVGVTVVVSSAGAVTITTNVSQAQFTVTGPSPSTATVSGTGTTWSNTNMAAGDYSVSFSHVTGYLSPQTKTFTVASGKETTVQANYTKKAAMTHIVALSNSNSTAGKNSLNVTVYTTAGDKVSSFAPFGARQVGAAHVAAGDLDGSGKYKIIVTDDQRTVNVFSLDGKELAHFILPPRTEISSVVAADLNNDGIAEIVLGTTVKPQGTRMVKLLSYSAVTNQLGPATTLYSEDLTGPFSLAVGDINGDQHPQVILADKSGIRAFALANGTLSQTWAVQGTFTDTPEVAAGDLNDDGMAEIAVSEPGAVHILSGSGVPTGVIISTPRTNPVSSSLAIGDVNNDGVDELVVGVPADANAASTMQVYKGDGTTAGSPLNAGGYGPTDVSLGIF